MITGFQVLGAQQHGNEVLVRVHYRVLAEMQDVMKVGSAEIDWTFHVIQTKSGWLIATGHFGNYMPRVAYVQALVYARHLENIINSPTDDVSEEVREQNERYRGYVAQLRKIASKTFKEKKN